MPRPWRVRPHLRYLITESGVNPREVKLHQRVHAAPETRPFLNADVVLCLQTIVFRTDWEDVYDVLLAEREAFTDAVRRQLDGEQAAVENLWPDLANLPDSLFEYLDSPADHQLLTEHSLDQYIHSVEATRSTQTGFAEAYRSLGKLRGILRTFESAPSPESRSELRTEFAKEARELRRAVSHASRGSVGAALQSDIAELSRPPEYHPGGPDSEALSELDGWHRSSGPLLTRVQNRLRDMRRFTGVGATSA